MKDVIFNFLGSKWLSFVIGLGMVGLLPFTYGNFMIVYDANAMGSNMLVSIIFAINILTIGVCTYKFLGSKPKPAQEEW